MYQLKHIAVYSFMFVGWRFWYTPFGYLMSLWILMSSNGYSNLSFHIILITRLIDVRTLKFNFVANVLILHSEKDFVLLQLYWWLFSSTTHCSWNMIYCVVNLQSYFLSYNYQHDKSIYYDCWITLKTAPQIAASNLYCKITFVWLDSSLSVCV